jgi:eukaryotic-like serine/threonine-protein kinase
MSLREFIKTKDFRKNLLRIVGVYVAVILVIWLYLAWYTDHGEYISVPEVRGMNFSEAVASIEDRDLKYVIVDSIYVEDAKGGTVMDQSPAAESQVKEGREVFLTTYRISPPLETINIEEGEYAQVALIKLSNKGIKVRKVEEPNNQMIGAVIKLTYKGKKLKSGSQVKRGEEVTMHIGVSANEQVLVPDLTGMTLDSAMAVLERAELMTGLTTSNSTLASRADSMAARVCSQSPVHSYDVYVPKGQIVDLWISIGPCEPDSTAVPPPSE